MNRMIIDLSLSEYGVDTRELARITARNILGQIGLKVVPDTVEIMDWELFQSKIPEIIKGTRFTVTDYTPSDDFPIMSDNNDLFKTDLIINLFFSRPEFHDLEQPYQIQEMTEDGRFLYSNGKTSEYNKELIDYIYQNLLEYYTSHYQLDDIQRDIENNYGEISLYVLSRILVSIQYGVFNEYDFNCTRGG